MSTEETGAPNLDAMPREELVEWASAAALDLAGTAHTLFPSHPRGYLGAIELLISYAQIKAMAMGLRHEGEIRIALAHETRCDQLYKQLPTFARW